MQSGDVCVLGVQAWLQGLRNKDNWWSYESDLLAEEKLCPAFGVNSNGVPVSGQELEPPGLMRAAGGLESIWDLRVTQA